MPDDLIDAPVDDAPAIEEPEPFTLPENFAEQVQSWGVPVESIPEAVEAYKRFQTEDGIIDGFIQFGQSLGFGLKELNTLFEPPPAPAAPAAPVAAPAEPEDPDRFLTAAEVQAQLAELRNENETYRQQQQQAQVQQQQAETHRGIETWFEGQEVKDEQVRTMIASFGQKHILPNQDPYDMRVITSALERGKAEYDAWVEAEAQRYLKGKAGTASAQPTPPGGSPAATVGNDEAPVDYAAARGDAFKVARDRVRARLREQGELG